MFCEVSRVVINQEYHCRVCMAVLDVLSNISSIALSNGFVEDSGDTGYFCYVTIFGSKD